MFDVNQYLYRLSQSEGENKSGSAFIMERKSRDKTGSEYISILSLVRSKINEKYRSELMGDLSTPEAKHRYMGLIEEILMEEKLSLDGLPLKALSEKLYHTMGRYDFLTPYLENSYLEGSSSDSDLPFVDSWEEINCNRWDDVEVMVGGTYEKLKEGFAHPDICVDIVKRMVLSGGVVIDGGHPRVDSFLGDSIRITATLPPCVDKEAGAAFSIRRQKKITNNMDFFLENGTAVKEELDFLSLCLNHGVSLALAGATGSGKTTDINYLLCRVGKDKRIYTVEDTRELSVMEKGAEGGYASRVVHTVTKKNENPSLRVTAEDLLQDALRYDPDVIGLGEARGRETRYSIEAGITGHTIIMGLHAEDARGGYRRLMGLCMDGGATLPEKMLLENIVEAIPIMVVKKRFPTGERRYTEIVEARLEGDLLNTKITLNPLYRYLVQGYEKDEGGKLLKVVGEHRQVGYLSAPLAARLYSGGVPLDVLKKYAGDEYTPNSEV